MKRLAEMTSPSNKEGAEILLSGKGSFCNLVELVLPKFNSFKDALKAIRLLARANYRQTCVNLDDGILQRKWHENNEFLRLCGVGLTGIAMTNYSSYDYKKLRDEAIAAANGMADELGTPRPKLVTTIKPSGTLSKIADVTEGLHKPLGRYIFNNVIFSNHDPLLAKLKEANHRVMNHPFDSSSSIVTFPVKYDGIKLDIVDGKEVNLESAVDQLNRYRDAMRSYVDHNASVTISYDPSEKEEILDWFMQNWDDYVGVSFLFRNDPTKTAKDLGYPYLPQEVVTKQEYESYVSTLKPLVIDEEGEMVDNLGEDCLTGACPIR